MWRNVGKKIKGLAKFIFWIETIVSVIVGIVLFIGDYSFAPILGEYGITTSETSIDFSVLYLIIFIVIIPLFAWIGSWAMYAFGELVDNSSKY